MTGTTITIPVDDDLARVFREAAPEDRRRMELLLNMKLRDITSMGKEENIAATLELMKRASATAQARGLTPGRLEELLRGE